MLPGGEALPELGRVVQLVPLPWSWWLSSGSVERRASGAAPKPGPSGSPSAHGARVSTCGTSVFAMHWHVDHWALDRNCYHNRGNAAWLSLVVVVVLTCGYDTVKHLITGGVSL